MTLRRRRLSNRTRRATPTATAGARPLVTPARCPRRTAANMTEPQQQPSLFRTLAGAAAAQGSKKAVSAAGTAAVGAIGWPALTIKVGAAGTGSPGKRREAA